MEEKNTVKINLSTFFLILAIIAIIVMGFFIYKMHNDNQESQKHINELNTKISNLKEPNIKNNQLNNETIEKEDELVSLSVNDDLVQKLYKYILKSDDFAYSFAWQNGLEPASFYKKDKVTYSSLSEIEKTLIVLKNYNDSEVKSVDKSSLKNVIDLTHVDDTEEIYDENMIGNTIKIYENINNKASTIFNQSNSNWKNYMGCSGALEYKNNNYYLIEFQGGGKGTSEFGYSKIQKAEKDGNYIYIYDKYIYIDSTNMDIGENDKKIHIYTTSDKMNDLGAETEKINLSDSGKEQLYKKYENQLKTFKHTFKKADDGSYYWLSSEIYN